MCCAEILLPLQENWKWSIQLVKKGLWGRGFASVSGTSIIKEFEGQESFKKLGGLGAPSAVIDVTVNATCVIMCENWEITSRELSDMFIMSLGSIGHWILCHDIDKTTCCEHCHLVLT